MTWWQRLWRRRKMEDQLEKELRFHLDLHASELIARGHDPQEAQRQARLALGGPEQVISDSLRSTDTPQLAILRPRLDASPILTICRNPTKEPFMVSTVAPSPLLGLELVPLYTTLFPTFPNTLPFPFAVLPYYHFLGRSFFLPGTFPL